MPDDDSSPRSRVPSIWQVVGLASAGAGALLAFDWLLQMFATGLGGELASAVSAPSSPAGSTVPGAFGAAAGSSSGAGPPEGDPIPPEWLEGVGEGSDDAGWKGEDAADRVKDRARDLAGKGGSGPVPPPPPPSLDDMIRDADIPRQDSEVERAYRKWRESAGDWESPDGPSQGAEPSAPHSDNWKRRKEQLWKGLQESAENLLPPGYSVPLKAPEFYDAGNKAMEGRERQKEALDYLSDPDQPFDSRPGGAGGGGAADGEGSSEKPVNEWLRKGKWRRLFGGGGGG